jgi:heme exporter protein A
VLAIEGLSGERRGRTLFSNLTFSLAPGNWLSIRGANGSGKSTLLKMLVGLFPSSVSIACFGPAIFIGHKTGLQLSLSPLENLYWLMALHPGEVGCPRAALEAWGLKNDDVPCDVLSFGQRKRVSLARLLLHRGHLWVLDEPLEGLDTAGIMIFTAMLASHLSEGGRAIIASHSSLDNDILRTPAKIITLGQP